MNINRAKRPWHRYYNWELWCNHHSRCIKLFALLILFVILRMLGDWVIDLYFSAQDANYKKIAVVEACWAKEMSGAPKTPEDQIVFKEPVGWKLASNWCKDGWQEECR